MTSKEFARKSATVRRELRDLSNFSADADQSTSQQTHFKSFAHIEAASAEICGTVEALVNSQCSKFAAYKTVQKICSSNSSKEIDLTLNHLSMAEPEEDDRRRPSSRLSTTLHSTTLGPAAQQVGDFSLAVLPPGKSEAEANLRQLIAECAEEKNKFTKVMETLESLLEKMKKNDEIIEAMDKEDKRTAKEEDDMKHVKNKIRKMEKEIQNLKKKEREWAKEEAGLRKRLEETRNCDQAMEEAWGPEDGEEEEQRLKEKLNVIEALTAWPVDNGREL